MRLNLLRLATVRLRRQWPLALAQLIGLAASVGLAVTVPLVQATASEAGLRSVVDGLGSQRFVTIEQLAVVDAKAYDAFQADAEQRTRAAAGGRLIPAARFIEGPKQTPFLLNGKAFQLDATDPAPDMASWEHLAAHVRVVQGAMPADAKVGSVYPVALSTQGARDFTFALGDTICFAPVNDPWCAQIAALYTPVDAGDPYWGGSLPQHSLMLGRNQYFGLVSEVNSRLPRPPTNFPVQPRTLDPGTAAQAWTPDFTNLHAGEISSFADELNGLRGYFAVQREGLFLTGLDTGVRGFQGRYQVASFTIQVVATALLVIALYSLSFVGGHFLDSQARVMAVLRGRGWSRRRVWMLLMTQVLLLALVAVPAGLLAAYVVSLAAGQAVFGGALPHLQRSDLAGLAPFTVMVVALAIGVLAVMAAGASRRGVLEVRRSSSRSDVRPFWQWRNLDLALAALSIPLLLEVQLRGSSRLRAASAAAQTDVVSLVLPALAMLLLAVASLRLLPLAARIVGRIGRGLPTELATWQMARQPVPSARLAVLLTTTVALGVFSAIYSATDHRNTVDRSGYAAGADVRAIFSGVNQQPPNVAQALPSIPNVVAATTTYRSTATPGKSNLDATLLAIDAGTFRQVAWNRGDLAAEPLDTLTEKLVTADPDGIALEGRPTALSLWVYSAGLPTSLRADVTDASGAHCACVLGDLGFTGERTLTVALDFGGPARYPLRIRGLELYTTGIRPASGDLALGSLTATAADGTAQVIESFEQHDGWWQEILGRAGAEDDLQASSRHLHGGRPSTTLDVRLSPGTPMFIRPAPTTRPLPALVSAQTLDKLGVGLNQVFPMHVDEVVVNVAAVGTVDYFPTFYPGRDDFLILPLDTLLARLGHEHYSLAWPNEAWLKLGGGTTATKQALRNSVGLLDVSDRSEIMASTLGDPLRLALQATLAIGFAAALAMAVVGFGLHFLVAARSRLSQYAVLQANGLPHRLVMRSLLAEQATMLLHGVVVGGLMALVMAWAILPSLQVSDSVSDLIPPTVVTFDPATIAAVLFGVTLVALAAGQAASRAGGHFRLRDELREL